MHAAPFPRSLRHTPTLLLAALAVGASSCSKSDSADDAAPAAASTGSASSTSSLPSDSTTAHDMGNMGNMANMPDMTGNPDQDFLRMMSNHHKGLILIAHMTKDRKDEGTAASDALRLDTKQDKELDQMVSMLEKDFKDPYAPKVMPQHQAMADALKTKSGKDYERTFYEDIIKHHEQAIVMINGYLPKAKNPTIKQMAEKMKADQSREIADFRKKVSQLGG